MEIRFDNGNFYRYTAGISRGAGSTARFNLIEWSVNGQTKSQELVQGVDTSREMDAAKAAAYSEAAGERYLVLNKEFVKAR